MQNSCTIIGCGWVGFPLAKALVRKGYAVTGTTTTPEKLRELQEAGIIPCLFKLPIQDNPPKHLWASDSLIVNIPPGREDPEVRERFRASVSGLLSYTYSSGIRRIIFVSSTSVYGAEEDEITEKNPADPRSRSGEALVSAEEMIRDSGKDYLILRFGGLAGPGRHPGRFMAGKKGLTNGHQSVNFLHQQDAVGVIIHLLGGSMWNETFNVVAPMHPLKAEFYVRMAHDLSREAPEFAEGSNANPKHARTISSGKLIKETGYKFIYEDPMTFEF